MSESTSKLHSLLFGDSGRTLVNIKFIPGDSRSLTSGQLSDAAAESISRAFDSGVNAPPRSGQSKCKLETFY